MRIGDEFSFDGGKTWLTLDDIKELVDLMSTEEKLRLLGSDRWAQAYLHPECFYCGVELPLDDTTKDELPQERMCQKCYQKEEAEIY